MIMRNRALLWFGFILLICLVFFGAKYFLSLRTMTVNYTNIHSVSIYRTSKLNNGSDKPVKKIFTSGEKIKLPKGDYTLHYDADKNYQSLFVNIHLTHNGQVVNLKPGYTDSYLDQLLSGQISGIDQAIIDKYPTVAQLYTIQRGKLYHQGDWYGTTLTYKGAVFGADLFRTDTLRVILHKENGQWTVETIPPYILLSRDSYPNIPEDILRNVNAMPSHPAG